MGSRTDENRGGTIHVVVRISMSSRLGKAESRLKQMGSRQRQVKKFHINAL